MSHPIRCKCGCLQGSVVNVKTANRGVCYCLDCQAFAHFLGRSSDILDHLGGTDIVQTLPKHVSFTQGTEVLACMRLTEAGLLRWYTRCCNTPIGNTLPSYKMSFVGLVHNCLESSEVTLDNSFGPARIRVHTKSAKGEPKPKQVGFLAAIARNIARILRARIDGSYKQTPFFSADSEMPVVQPKVLSDREYKDIMSSL